MTDLSEYANITDPEVAIAMGKRNLLVQDFTAAAAAFATGCQLLATKHGDMADELGDAYLSYGRALLHLSREEAGVLGTGVPGQDEEDDDEEMEDEEGADEGETKDVESQVKPDEKVSETTKTDVESKPEEKEKEAETANKEKEPQTVDKEKEYKSEEKVAEKESDEAAKPASTNGTSSEPQPGHSGSSKTEFSKPSTSGHQNGVGTNGGAEEGDDIEEEDENSNLQLAWEVLELAKLIIAKRGQPGWKLLAEAHRLLGEVAMESGNQAGALTDLNACMDLLGRIEPNDPRSIAETHYQLGLAYSLGNEFDASIESFQKATSLLEERIAELEALGDKVTAPIDDPTYTVAAEIKELKELLPEIQDKIADMKDFKQEASKVIIEKIKSQVASGSCSNGSGPSSAGDDASTATSVSETAQEAKPVSDISHLVRKKRKQDEPDSDLGSPCKKPTPEKVG